ncbi:MAG: MSMEG_0565 family glycosyltransferase [Cyanobacteria bacterium J06598_3]
MTVNDTVLANNKMPANNKPLRIALLTYATKPRGSVVHTLELAQALQALGHEPCVFALDKDGQGFYREVSFKTVAVPAQPCEDGIDALIKQRIQEFVDFFEHFFERENARYDIYHAQDCLSANALAVLKNQKKIACFVRTVHHIEDYKSPYLQACQEKSIYQSDRCLCVSKVWQQTLQTDYGIQAHRVINGVSERFSAIPNETDAKTAQACGINLAAGPIYLTVGGIEPRKNSIRLLKAFSQVRKEHARAKLIIVGGATLFDYQDYRRDFMALVAQAGLQDALILPGVVSDEALPSVYRLADAFVFPSVQEGWGLVVLEAIASGLPVLTANRAPFTEFLSTGAAKLVDPENIDAIAQAMMAMVKPNVAQALIQQSAESIEHYQWKTSAQMHLDLYRQLVP